jgi:hypothetical protein
VRIGLDPRELRDHPLFLGLSTDVEIDIHDIDGSSLSQQPVWQAGMQTDIYTEQDAGVEPEMRRILDENLRGSQGTFAPLANAPAPPAGGASVAKVAEATGPTPAPGAPPPRQRTASVAEQTPPKVNQ